MEQKTVDFQALTVNDKGAGYLTKEQMEEMWVGGKKTDQIIKATMDSNNSIKDNGQQQIKVKLLSMTTSNQGLLSCCHTDLKTLL